MSRAHNHAADLPGRKIDFIWRGVLTVTLGLWAMSLGGDPERYTWLDTVDLAIHETGHLVFGFGGELLTIAGGTLLQLLIPAALGVALWRTGDRHGATIPVWWVGQNLWNVARYAEDARAQDLPLVGDGEHDWTWLLDHFNALEHDQAVGGWFRTLGTLVIAGSVLWGLYEVRRRYLHVA